LSDLFEDSKAPDDTARRFVPPDPDLDKLKKAAAGCTACPLHERGTQTVFGEGRAGSRVMLIGEQPGDQEDLAGQPFVGPAGRVLDEALEEVGIPRAEVYVTNAVKHFKWEPRGKRRIHQKPTLGEVKACRPWLETELALVRPQIIVCLGATAAQSLLGPQFRITRDHGLFFETSWAPWTTATLHPSAILRMPDAEARLAARLQLVDDLRKVAEHLQKHLQRKT
jgi:uracil-DNA glycosylase family protein